MGSSAELFPGGGDTGTLIRDFDWTRTPLGPASSWSTALKSLVRTMMNSRQPMLLWWGPELTQLYNDALLPSLQTKHPSALGQRARDCWAEVWPIVGGQVEAVLTHGEPIWSEDVLVPVLRHGRLEDAWWIYSYSPAFDDAGAIAGVVVICTETTATVTAHNELERAKREAECAREELRSVFMQAPMPIAIMTGPEHRFTLTNGAHDRLVARHPLGQTLAQAFSESEVIYSRPTLDRVFATGDPAVIREAEVQLRNATGDLEQRYLDVSYHPYRSVDGATLGVLAMLNDVTWSVAAREREQTLRFAAEAASRARDEFLAILGHELRNPLAPISTATQLMRLRGDLHEKERKIIERQVTHLSRLVDDLLDVARVAGGKIELQRTDVEISEVVSKAVEMVSPLLEQRAHKLIMNVPRTGLVVDGDPVRLAQVIGNLVNNAAKYTPPQGLIEISARRQGDEVQVIVADDGPGIHEELLPRVFDLFVQGPQRMDRAEGGLGLGLALVKNLVTLHGGTVAARNRSRGGSEFFVTVPARSATAAIRAPQATPALFERAAAAMTTRRVLVVDDNEDAAELLSELLRGIGHEVVVAHDGPQALAALRSFDAEVGLLDIGLPGMDGFELARRIREQRGGNGLRLIAVTGYGQEHDREDARAAGFDRHLTKPVALDELLGVIET